VEGQRPTPPSAKRDTPWILILFAALALVGGSLLGLQILAGHLEITFYAAFALLFYALARLAPQATISLQQGDEGSTVLEGGRVFRPRRRPTVQVVDPIGAGDAYAAGFLWAVLHGRDLQDAVDAGTAVAALKCSTWGDIALVSAEDVADVLAGGPDVRR